MVFGVTLSLSFVRTSKRLLFYSRFRCYSKNFFDPQCFGFSSSDTCFSPYFCTKKSQQSSFVSNVEWMEESMCFNSHSKILRHSIHLDDVALQSKWKMSHFFLSNKFQNEPCELLNRVHCTVTLNRQFEVSALKFQCAAAAMAFCLPSTWALNPNKFTWFIFGFSTFMTEKFR